MAIRLRKRHRLRRKEIKALAEKLQGTISVECFSVEDTIDRAEVDTFSVLLVNGEILGLIIDDQPFLSIKGILRFRPQRRGITVDMGAVKFIYNGADVMAPGIVGADPDIVSGDLVWVADEKNRQPLAVGRALMDAGEMQKAQSGKAVESIHHVGDDIWNYEP